MTTKKKQRQRKRKTKSKQKKHKVSCNKCGIKFNIDISEKSRSRMISSIEEKIEQKGDKPEMTDNKDNENKEVVNVPEPLENSNPTPDDQTKDQSQASVPTEIVNSSDKKKTAPIESAELVIHLGQNLESTLEESKKLTYEDRKNLKDDNFAVIKTVKNEKTGKQRKIRMFPINDK